MKILILSSKLPYPPKDGGALATLNLALGLAKSGIDVTMLAVNTKKHFFDPAKIPGKIQSAFKWKTVYKDTSLKPLCALKNLLFSRNPYIAERYFFKSLNRELEELLLQNKFDMVQIEGPYLYPYVKTIRQNSSAKICLRAHNIEYKIWQQRWKSETSLLKQIYLRNMTSRIKKMEKNMVNSADLVAAISNEDEQYFKQINPGVRTITIPAGLDLSQYELSDTSPKNSIFFLGSLDWMPNREGLLWFKNEAFPVLLEYKKDLVFHVAGRNAPEKFLSELEHPNIIFHGEIEDAVSFMNKYRIMAVPLLTGSGIRIKIIEGMALGKCIVTTSLGAEGIKARDGKEILIANHAKKFAERITELIENPERADSISNAARKFILGNFDTFAIASNLYEQYRKII